MTTAQTTRPMPYPGTEARPPVASRISFRQPVSKSGFIDAAWWPRSRDLALELPPLMEVLWTSAREITRIAYNLDAWDPAPRRLQIEGRVLRLGGFHTGDPSIVRLSDMWGADRIDILVIAADADPDAAQRALTIAARADQALRAAEIRAEAGLDAAAGS